ncbi:ragulator complex protein LAMTOR4 homolog [Agrilus planipennis]|uniref:Late endosomal/lysosomal adaptor and MAPK and MTOR activator 4 n=1 Tax=Agrilus planipennis TaxID=224129 RepID=A0A1W4WFX4_AGRPL|nr:ragulator complex protein LAMTOR4 homolog [Agrilus planipennis]
MERIPDQLGHLVINEDGAVLMSSGDLENDEKTADIILNLLNLTDEIDPVAFPSGDKFKKLSITYSDHCYIICLSNRKVHVVKKALNNEWPSVLV